MNTPGTPTGGPLPVQRETLVRTALSAAYDGMFAWSIRNGVGESPVWDADASRLFWIDIRAPAVLCLDPATGDLTRWLLPEVVGALGLAGAHQVVLALQHHLALLDTATGMLRHFADIPGEAATNRLNEGKVSPGGRWFVFGSMDDRASNKQPVGALYRADTDGTVQRLFHGVTVANGIAWTPDGASILFSDSFAGRIWRASWDEPHGAMGEPAPFATSVEEQGRPDGALMGLDGHYVSAGVSAGCLNTFDHRGARVGHRALPVRAPTMPCIGGVDGSRLFVTSLVRPGWDTSATLDGALIEMAAPCRVAPAMRWGLVGQAG